MAESTSNTGNKHLRRLFTFVLLLIFWFVFSGQFDLFHGSLGVVSCALVAFLSHDLLFARRGGNGVQTFVRFSLYVPWLVYQVILANLHVAKLVLMPSGIKPQIVTVKSKLKSDMSKVAFANSITLTPGTITMDIIDGEFHVHALSQAVADDLLSGEMENRVARVFDEE